jgi:hypothetical protein
MPRKTPASLFTLPAAEERDSARPHAIVHSCDYLLRDDGTLEFHYNYLDYFWEIDGAKIRARHYLDRPRPLTVAVMMDFKLFDQRKYVGILNYLQRRFAVIETFDSKGYTVRWKLGPAGRS